MADSYDAIVIGAGMGGLAAGARLAKLGHRVLLLERHHVPGGYGTSFVRGRYEFEVALHQIAHPDTADRQRPFHHVLEGLGVLDQLAFHRLPLFYRSYFPDADITVPAGVDGFVDAIGAAFPDQAEGVRTFTELALKMGRQLEVAAEAVQPVDGSGPRPTRIVQLPVKARSLLRYAGVTVSQVLERHVTDPRARAVVTQTWGYYGMPPSALSFLYFAAGTGTFLESGPCYLHERSQGLSSALVGVIEAGGGAVRTSCGVDRVLQRAGRVDGVVTEHGETFQAPVVISNASPLTTCRELMDPDTVPRSFWRRLRSATVGPSSFNVFLGLARPAAELGLTDNDFWINEGWDHERHYGGFRTLAPPTLLMGTAHSHGLPQLAPEGCSTLTLTALYHADPWLRLQPERYVETKNRIASAMLDLVEARYPGVRDAIEEIEVATPITNMRYTSHPGGAIYGFDQPPSEAIIWRLPNQGPLPGLYFAGAWTLPGGGFEPTLCSGYNAGCLAHQQLGGA